MADPTLVHATSASENPDPSAWPVWFYGLVGTLGVILSVLALEILFGLTTEAEERKKSNSLATVEMLKIREDQTLLLESFHWVDEPNGVVAIPIERAMQIVIDEAAESDGR